MQHGAKFTSETSYQYEDLPAVNRASLLAGELNEVFVTYLLTYRGADKFLARPGRKQVNFSIRIA